MKYISICISIYIHTYITRCRTIHSCQHKGCGPDRGVRVELLLVHRCLTLAIQVNLLHIAVLTRLIKIRLHVTDCMYDFHIMYVYMYCMYVYLYVCKMYVNECIVDMCIYESMYVCLSVCGYVSRKKDCMYVYIYICMYVCM